MREPEPKPFDALTEALAAAFERGEKIGKAASTICFSDQRHAIATSKKFAVICIQGSPSQDDLDLLLDHAGIARQPVMIAGDMSEAFFAKAARLRVRCYEIEYEPEEARDMGAVVFYDPAAGIMCTVAGMNVGFLEVPGVKEAIKETIDTGKYHRALIRFRGEPPVEFSLGTGRAFKAGAVGKMPRQDVAVMPSGTWLLLDAPGIPPLPLYELHLNVTQGTAQEWVFRPGALTLCTLRSVGGVERPIEFSAAHMFRPALVAGDAIKLCHLCWRRCGEKQRTYVALKQPLTGAVTLPIVPPPTEGFMECCIYCANALASRDDDQLNHSMLALAFSHDDDNEVMTSLGAYMFRLHRHAQANFEKILEVR